MVTVNRVLERPTWHCCASCMRLASTWTPMGPSTLTTSRSSTWPPCAPWCRRWWGTSPWWVRTNHGHCSSFKIIDMTLVHSLVQVMVGNLPWWVRASHGNCLSFKIIYMTSLHSMVQEMVGKGPGISSACSGHGNCLSFFLQMLVKERRALARTNSDAHEGWGCTLVSFFCFVFVVMFYSSFCATYSNIVIVLIIN